MRARHTARHPTGARFGYGPSCIRAFIACATLGIVTPAAAEPPPPELRYDLALDLSVTAVAGGAWIGSELLQAQIAPSSCRWCDVDGLDSAVRDAARWSNTSAADTASGVTGFVVAPLFAFGADALAAVHDGRGSRVGVDALTIAEATVLAMDVNQAVKLAVARERPFVHALSAAAKASTSQPSENNLSFFSGHTTEAFALATAAGTVATLRGYTWAPLVWAVGMPVAAATGYLRIAADKHYLTDVLTGAIVGGAFGFGVPFLFHRPVTASGSGTPALTLQSVWAGGTQLSVAGVW